jgi:hypothetical protein
LARDRKRDRQEIERKRGERERREIEKKEWLEIERKRKSG